jgi:hypothetical protein
MKKLLLVAAVMAVGFTFSASAEPDKDPVATSTDTVTGLQKAQGTASNLPGDGAVKADTQPKPSQVGQDASVFRPKPPPLDIKEPPSPKPDPELER